MLIEGLGGLSANGAFIGKCECFASVVRNIEGVDGDLGRSKLCEVLSDRLVAERRASASARTEFATYQ